MVTNFGSFVNEKYVFFRDIPNYTEGDFCEDGHKLTHEQADLLQRYKKEYSNFVRIMKKRINHSSKWEIGNEDIIEDIEKQIKEYHSNITPELEKIIKLIDQHYNVDHYTKKNEHNENQI